MNKEKNKKLGALKKTENNLYGMGNEITFGTNVTNNPFPYSEEGYASKEEYEYGEIKTNNP